MTAKTPAFLLRPMLEDLQAWENEWANTFPRHRLSRNQWYIALINMALGRE